MALLGGEFKSVIPLSQIHNYGTVTLIELPESFEHVRVNLKSHQLLQCM
jgi:hypothetical protein